MAPQEVIELRLAHLQGRTSLLAAMVAEKEAEATALRTRLAEASLSRAASTSSAPLLGGSGPPAQQAHQRQSRARVR